MSTVILKSKYKLQNRSGEDGNGEKESGKAKTFDFVNVVAEKNKKTGSGADGKTGKSRTERNCAFRIKLSDDYRGSTVRNKTNHSGDKRLEEAFVCDESGKTFFADKMYANFESKHHNKDESEGFCCMGKGAFKKPVVAFGVAMGMFFLNFLEFFFCDVEEPEAVHKKSGDDCKNKL